MSDQRKEQVNSPGADRPSPGTEDRSPLSSETGGRVVQFPSSHGKTSSRPPSAFSLRLRRLLGKAGEYADQMYQQAEPTPEQLEAERYIPGVDREEFVQSSGKPRRLRRRPLPEDVPPADLTVRFRTGLRGMRLRLPFCLLTALFALYVALSLPLPSIPLGDLSLRLICSVAALGAAIVLAIDVMADGLIKLFTLHPNGESLCALAALITLCDALTMPTLGFRNGALPFAAPVCFALFLTLWGRYLKQRADFLSCRVASQAKKPYLLTLDESKWSGRPAYARRSSELTGFGSQVLAPNCTQLTYSVAAPLLLLTCLVCALLASVGAGKPAHFLWAFSAVLTAAATFSAPLAFALPYWRITRRLGRSGSALAGWPGVERCRPHSLILTDTDLFPSGSAKGNGMKISPDFLPEKVVGCTGTLIRASGCGLGKVFSDLMRSQNALYRPVTGVCFHEGGITGIIHNQEVMVGTAAFLRLMNVELPQGLHVKNAVFCAIDGQWAGIFVIHYTLRSDVEASLNALIQSRIRPLLATRDPNLIPSVLGQKFQLPVGKMEFPSIDRRLELSDPAQAHDPTVTAVLQREGLLSYSDAAIGACRLRSAARLGTLLSVIGGVLGVVLSFYLTFVSAYHSLSAPALFLFLLVWLFPVLLLSDWATRY